MLGKCLQSNEGEPVFGVVGNTGIQATTSPPVHAFNTMIGLASKALNFEVCVEVAHDDEQAPNETPAKDDGRASSQCPNEEALSHGSRLRACRATLNDVCLRTKSSKAVLRHAQLFSPHEMIADNRLRDRITLP